MNVTVTLIGRCFSVLITMYITNIKLNIHHTPIDEKAFIGSISEVNCKKIWIMLKMETLLRIFYKLLNINKHPHFEVKIYYLV